MGATWPLHWRGGTHALYLLSCAKEIFRPRTKLFVVHHLLGERARLVLGSVEIALVNHPKLSLAQGDQRGSPHRARRRGISKRHRGHAPALAARRSSPRSRRIPGRHQSGSANHNPDSDCDHKSIYHCNRDGDRDRNCDANRDGDGKRSDSDGDAEGRIYGGGIFDAGGSRGQSVRAQHR